jgi:lipopolysaccharide heptosyltransferase II
MTGRIHNILVIKFCAIGDLVFLTPMLQALRHKYPDSTISLTVSNWVLELLPCVPGVNETVVSDAPYEPSLLRKIVGAVRLLKRGRAFDPDLVVVGHRNSLFGLLAYLTGAPQRIGFTGTRFLTHTVPFVSSDHEIDRYLAILRCVGVGKTSSSTLLKIQDRDLRNLDNKLIGQSIIPGEPLVVIFPGGGENPAIRMTIKRWLTERYGELIRRIVERYHNHVILIGSADERSLCAEVASEAPGVVNLAGMLTLREIVALGRYCALMLGGDSGVTHLIAATGAPTLSLFGPSDPRLVAPMGKNQTYLWKQPACAPCYTPETTLQKKYFAGNTFVCHIGTHECMRLLTVDDVWRKVVEELSSPYAKNSWDPLSKSPEKRA